MEFGSFDSRGNGEQNVLSDVEISKIFVTQDNYFLGQCHMTEYSSLKYSMPTWQAYKPNNYTGQSLH